VKLALAMSAEPANGSSVDNGSIDGSVALFVLSFPIPAAVVSKLDSVEGSSGVPSLLIGSITK
jgi:hypothetical protein